MAEVFSCPVGSRATWDETQRRHVCINDAGEIVEPIAETITPSQGPVGLEGYTPRATSEEDWIASLLAPPARIEIETIGGYDYAVAYDKDDNVISREIIYPQRERGREPWEEEQSLWERQYLQKQFTWEQEESRRQAGMQQQQYLAGLAAKPLSWLEYAAASRQPPVVQPWMLPLMPQEYSQLQAGQAIPGYTPTSMAGMPELTRPSRQYQARMGPTSLQQYQGYRQARTGERPEETEFRLWSKAPPSGQFSPIGYRK